MYIKTKSTNVNTDKFSTDLFQCYEKIVNEKKMEPKPFKTTRLNLGS